MYRFHKWCYNAVQGLGILCLWYELTQLVSRFIGLYTSAILWLFLLGWAVSYKEDNN